MRLLSLIEENKNEEELKSEDSEDFYIEQPPAQHQRRISNYSENSLMDTDENNVEDFKVPNIMKPHDNMYVMSN